MGSAVVVSSRFSEFAACGEEVWVADAMNVDPELLVTSGGVLDEHSQSVFAAHSAADQTIESSLFSGAGQSQAALAAKAAAWTTATTTLTARLYEHAEGLRTSGLTFAAMDQRDAETLTR
jgi:hypothetical protein